MINLGIIGAGHIAETMADVANATDGIRPYAVASRSVEKAQDYKERYHMQKAYGSYADLVMDDNVNLVYIATPHSLHYRHAKMCLEHGKGVLCEKAFTVNTAQAEKLINYAERQNLFLCEAMWTRFMPLYGRLSQLVESKVVGDIPFMSANLGFSMTQKERLIKPELAGGALLDVGIYPLTMAVAVMGNDIKEIHAVGTLSNLGVDLMGQYTLVYKNGSMADLNSSMCAFGDGRAVLYGTGGTIVVNGVNCIDSIDVYDENGGRLQHYEKDPAKSGYAYELEECISVINEGKIECPHMKHEDTLEMMRLLDEVRKQMGVRYTCDERI